MTVAVIVTVAVTVRGKRRAVPHTSRVRSCCNCLSTTPGMYPIWLSIDAAEEEKKGGEEKRGAEEKRRRKEG